MKKVLFVNCCIRREQSRSLKLAKKFLDALDPKEYEIEELCLMDEPLEYFKDSFFAQRERLLAEKKFDHPRFRYAWQFKDADNIVVAAPFWDLSFPALLKVYIENISVDGITFGYNENGPIGLCKADKLVFVTTRGGCYAGSNLELGAKYMEALCEFFGIDKFECVCAEGIDIYGADVEGIMGEAEKQARKIAAEF